MADQDGKTGEGAGSPADALGELFRTQAHVTEALIGKILPTLPLEPDEAARWTESMRKLQELWLEFQTDKAGEALDSLQSPPAFARPETWFSALSDWYGLLPMSSPEAQGKLLSEGLSVWETVLGQYGIGPKTSPAGEAPPALPRQDKRFKDPRWREEPWFALLHQTYLLLAEQITGLADGIEGLDPQRKEQLRFATRAMIDAFSPANFVLTNPVALEKARETGGESLVRGAEHALADLRRGQLTHTDPDAFRLGENIAATPGKVVHETALYQLIQYTPTTDTVLGVPLVIFPPWINRFYILDLNPAKSFVRWAVEQGISVFMVSWKSADETLADVVWDDYIRAQIDAIDVVRERLGSASVHTIGYCVGGTTLSATLAVLARRGEAAKVKSATLFTAQVDFEEPGDLKLFIDDAHLAAINQLSPDGYLDGRYMAATFNLLRGQDLIWNYVVNNYLLGEDYPAFDMLHWNGDVTNLPVKWHQDYLRDLYRDNLLIVPDRLCGDGTPIDLGRIETPCFVQAGREDHIAPPESVWKIIRHVKGPVRFVLAGSGHIAGVVNPPAAGKYQYWTNDAPASTLEEFIAGASEHPGSWWPHWLDWLRAHDPSEVKASGKRRPGGRGDRVIEDAPGRYVMTR